MGILLFLVFFFKINLLKEIEITAKNKYGINSLDDKGNSFPD